MSARWSRRASVLRELQRGCGEPREPGRARTAHGEEGGHAAGELSPQRAAALWGWEPHASAHAAQPGAFTSAQQRSAAAPRPDCRAVARRACMGRRATRPGGGCLRQQLVPARAADSDAGGSARARTRDAEKVVDRRGHDAQHLVVGLGDHNLVWRRAQRRALFSRTHAARAVPWAHRPRAGWSSRSPSGSAQHSRPGPRTRQRAPPAPQPEPPPARPPDVFAGARRARVSDAYGARTLGTARDSPRPRLAVAGTVRLRARARNGRQMQTGGCSK